MIESEINQKIQNFLKNGKPSTPLSINERSLQVFGDEKFLSSSECKKVLNQYHLSSDLFYTYPTPEPFIYYRNRSNSKDALIIENKDTWYTMRKILMESGKICNMDFQAILYGEGRKIQSSFSYMESDDTRDIHDITCFYYFGDLDSSGIDILYQLQRQYPGYSILPFEIGYRYLYQNKNLGHRKQTKKISINYRKLHVLDFFDEDIIEDLHTLCNQNYIIPQEILNYDVLRLWDIFDL